jgi:hypothetical protein
MPFPMQEPVKIGMGEMTMGGMLLTGFNTEMREQEGYGDDGIWKSGVINAVNAENRVDLYLNYKILDYGVFVNLRSQGYGQNQFGSPDIPHFNAYANFFDKKLKISAGRLNDWIWPLLDTHIWQTWHYGEMWYLTSRGPGAVRVEIKPIDGLNFGFQFPFVNQTFAASDFSDDSALYSEASADARKDAWREFGFGAEYVQEKFKVTAGLQLDSKMDKMTRDDFRTYLDEYYGSANMLAFMPAAVKFKEAPDPDYDGGLFAYAGTRINLIKNFEIDLQIGLLGLGAFDQYGYGRANQHIGYTVEAVPGLGLSVNGEQQFYGANVFQEGIINSPLITFSGGASYALPFMKNVSVIMEGSGSFCQDVLDAKWEICPKVAININKIVPVCTVEIFYKVNHTDYQDAIEADAAKPQTNHSLNVSVSVYF